MRNRRGKTHLQFPLYNDEEIGFTKIICESLAVSSSIVENSADEDYETDGDILRRTVNMCKKDCWKALGPVGAKQKDYNKVIDIDLSRAE